MYIAGILLVIISTACIVLFIQYLDGGLKSIAKKVDVNGAIVVIALATIGLIVASGVLEIMLHLLTLNL